MPLDQGSQWETVLGVSGRAERAFLVFTMTGVITGFKEKDQRCHISCNAWTPCTTKTGPAWPATLRWFSRCSCASVSPADHYLSENLAPSFKKCLMCSAQAHRYIRRAVLWRFFEALQRVLPFLLFFFTILENHFMEDKMLRWY